MRSFHTNSAFAILCALLWSTLLSGNAAAAGPSKEACVDAHSRGQDARDQGKVTFARKLFMTCAQEACPALVQADCARYADELERTHSSLTFAARDSAGNDLPDTTVYLDDALLLARLDDGKAHEVDPGKHVVRFAYGGREQVVTLVVGRGEKARPVMATFETAVPSAPKAALQSSEPKLETTHSLGSRIALGASAAVTATGVVLGIVGLSRVPKECSLSSHQCASPPDSAAFDRASKAVELANIGWVITGVGAAAATGAAVWYVKSKRTDRETRLKPMVSTRSVGVLWSGRF